MLKKIFRILLYGAIIFSKTNAYADINYYITHKKNIIYVKIDLGKPKSEDVKLYIPDKVWGTNYSKQITKLLIKNGKCNSNGTIKVLNKNKNLVIMYEIINLPKKEFIDHFCFNYYQYIDDTKFFLLGMGFFIHPESEDYEEQKVIIHFNSNVKKVFYNFAPYILINNVIETNIKELKDIVILGNENISFIENSIQNTKLIIWSSDKSLAMRINNIVSKVLSQHKTFWEDNKIKPLVIFIPNPFFINKNRWGGTVINNTLLTFINPATNEDIDLLNLVNHEGLHLWFGANLINGPKWFTEGFTEYYMDKIHSYFTKSNNELIKNYNQKLSLYFSSPVHNLNDKSLEDNFFKISILEKIPYWKGYLIAGQIDSIIDLDFYLRKIIKECRAEGKTYKFSSSFLLNKLEEDISLENRKRIKNLIDNFDDKNLTDYLLNNAKLSFIDFKSYKYDLNIVKIIEDGFIPGNYLNKLDDKYQIEFDYPLLDVRENNTGIIHLITKESNFLKKIFLKKESITVKIPFYKLDKNTLFKHDLK